MDIPKPFVIVWRVPAKSAPETPTLANCAPSSPSLILSDSAITPNPDRLACKAPYDSPISAVDIPFALFASWRETNSSSYAPAAPDEALNAAVATSLATANPSVACWIVDTIDAIGFMFSTYFLILSVRFSSLFA